MGAGGFGVPGYTSFGGSFGGPGPSSAGFGGYGPGLFDPGLYGLGAPAVSGYVVGNAGAQVATDLDPRLQQAQGVHDWSTMEGMAKATFNEAVSCGLEAASEARGNDDSARSMMAALVKWMRKK